MICHRLKKFFLHPAKTGGTSVETALLLHEIGHLDPTEHQKQIFALWTKDAKQHWPYAKMIREFPFLIDWDSFATVRHPYDRMTSEFRYQLAGNRKQRSSRAHEQEDLNSAILNDSLWNLAWGWHMAAQSDYIGPNTKVVKLEDIDEEWPKLGLADLPFINRSENRKRFELNSEAKRKIQHYYAADFERLGYDP